MSQNDYFSHSPRNYVSNVKESIEMSENLSKANTEKRVVEPFFQLLNWPLSVPEEDCSVELDYKVGEDTMAEYAFVSDDKPLVFVKTISFEETLPSEVTVENVLEEEFNWGILTNGEKYEFYRMIDGVVELVESFELDNLTDYKDFLTYMTSSSLLSGRTSTESEEYDSSVVDRRHIYSETSDMSDRLVDSVETIEDDDLRSEVDKLENSLDRLLGFDSYFTVSEGQDENEEHHDEEHYDDEVENNDSTDTVEEESENLRSFDSSVHEGDEETEDDEKADAEEGKLEGESSSESSDGSSDDSSDEKSGGLGGLFSFLTP